jgi:hypothetical protein
MPFVIPLLLPLQSLQELFSSRKLKNSHRSHPTPSRCGDLTSPQRERDLMASLSSIGTVPQDHPLRSNLEDCVLQWEGFPSLTPLTDSSSLQLMFL